MLIIRREKTKPSKERILWCPEDMALFGISENKTTLRSGKGFMIFSKTASKILLDRSRPRVLV